jgi:hypothetical protein
MLIKILVLLVLFFIVANLFTALFHLIRGGQGASKKTLKFLTLRLVLSILLFASLYVLAYLGYIQPHGFPDGNRTLAAPTATTGAPQ